MEHQVANRRVKCLSQAVIGEGETEVGGPRADCQDAQGMGAGAPGAFLFTTSVQEPETHAAGPDVLGLVADRTGGGR